MNPPFRPWSDRRGATFIPQSLCPCGTCSSAPNICSSLPERGRPQSNIGDQPACPEVAWSPSDRRFPRYQRALRCAEPIVDIFDDLTHNRAVHAGADLNALNFELQWELADLRCLRLHAGYGGLAGRFMNKLSRWNAVAQV
jgi:hypothetical protein